MNEVFVPPGTKILFNHPKRGTNNDVKNAKQHLKPGAQYTVLYIKATMFSVRVFLKEVPVISFPPSMFDLADTTPFGWFDYVFGENGMARVEDI